MAVKVGQAGSDNRLGDRFTTMTAHRLALTIDHRRVRSARRNWQATVEARLWKIQGAWRYFIYRKHGQ
jgi:hypothetical protein